MKKTILTIEKEPVISLNKRFLNHVMRNWELNNHYLKEIPCVYVMVALNYKTNEIDIVYVGSTTKLCSRYRSHKIPYRIQDEGNLNLMYYLPMEKRFRDYEIKLIKKLKPIYNKQHNNGA